LAKIVSNAITEVQLLANSCLAKSAYSLTGFLLWQRSMGDEGYINLPQGLQTIVEHLRMRIKVSGIHAVQVNHLGAS